ncbi:MAG: MptD family putative ECF transporter S component [Peptoniphilus harei]|uniref:MptD family putative ECF transporter S component n=1 Tax=Peptoniphilus harei TaxID=54005 RepID=UPI0025509829|nr:MptD family putative ECF transporter S component [Peptoniphilus harei]HEQ3792092.1 MptD family putative ECF transporter S component [Streptococcus pyogenes]MDK7755526.1 MptD family putative ECF transporter S component [Peptoniphilus harei]MDK7761123.1 MptD family putative ECF transporter S component [Peptoniphilus harei]MDK8270913.1 MptD family putative ECF transporter S component [Peptoniphilus harei]MDK8339491.1 MptD family putative ECF transporter S component [Peptoniphilus harei]
MKLKDIVQVTIFTVVAFILNMAVSTATGMLGTLSLYIAAGFSSFVVAPPFIIMAKKLQKRGIAFIFFMLLGVFYALSGYWPMIIVNAIAAIVAELIIGNYKNDNRVALAVSAGMFVISMHAMTFVRLLGPEKIVEVFSVFTKEQAAFMDAFFTPKAMLISIGINIVLVLIAGRFGLYINNKFFTKSKKSGIL